MNPAVSNADRKAVPTSRFLRCGDPSASRARTRHRQADKVEQHRQPQPRQLHSGSTCLRINQCPPEHSRALAGVSAAGLWPLGRTCPVQSCPALAGCWSSLVRGKLLDLLSELTVCCHLLFKWFSHNRKSDTDSLRKTFPVRFPCGSWNSVH